MLDKKSFEHIRKELKEYEIKREKTIQDSRVVITLSKQIIYAVHRGDIKTAENLVKKIKIVLERLRTTRHYDIGISNVAFQEYVEAICYYEFIKHEKLPRFQDLDVKIEDYLLGICDFVGEIARKAVAYATKNKFDKVVEIRDLIETIYGEFLHLELRNWDIRKKADTLKWHLHKLEDLVFTLQTGGRTR